MRSLADLFLAACLVVAIFLISWRECQDRNLITVLIEERAHDFVELEQLREASRVQSAMSAAQQVEIEILNRKLGKEVLP